MPTAETKDPLKSHDDVAKANSEQAKEPSELQGDWSETKYLNLPELFNQFQRRQPLVFISAQVGVHEGPRGTLRALDRNRARRPAPIGLCLSRLQLSSAESVSRVCTDFWTWLKWPP